MVESFEDTYPTIALWVKSWGWIEIGQGDYSKSLIRVFDEGGMIWESAERYPSLDDAFRALETALTEWMDENG